jgi:hypothetical protein
MRNFALGKELWRNGTYDTPVDHGTPVNAFWNAKFSLMVIYSISFLTRSDIFVDVQKHFFLQIMNKDTYNGLL